MSDEDTQRQMTYEVRAVALVEALADYEQGHPEGTPCFSEALALMRQVVTP